MSSTFDGEDIFGSGPHRFSIGPVGEYVLTLAEADPYQPGSQPIGPLEAIVTVRGRLVADSDSDLWELRDAVAAQLSDPPKAATLIDHHEHEWTDMSFIRFEEHERTDRGRRVSVGYTATFIRFAS